MGTKLLVCPLKYGSYIMKHQVLHYETSSGKVILIFIQEDLSREMGRWEGNGNKRISKGEKSVRWERQMRQRDDMNKQLKWQERKCYRTSLKEKGRRSNILLSLAFLCSCMSPHSSSTFYLFLLIEDCEAVEKFICHGKSERGSYQSGKICAFSLHGKWRQYR